jgi:hypothetical protein
MSSGGSLLTIKADLCGRGLFGFVCGDDDILRYQLQFSWDRKILMTSIVTNSWMLLVL